jgi:hypothetical protein
LQGTIPNTALPGDEISPNDVRRHLALVLQSKPFLSSRRGSEFLRYVVEHALAQDEGGLKERVIALEVFGRKSVGEGIEDSVVRVCARELRKRLERYYGEQGANDSIRIELPVGCYAPTFRRSQAPAGERAVAQSRRSWKQPWLAALIVAGILLAIASAVIANSRYHKHPNFRTFWAPVTERPGPALVCVGPTVVYGFSQRMTEEYLRRHPSAIEAGREVIDFPAGGRIPADDLVSFTDDRFTSGALDAAIRLAQLLERHGKTAQFRFGSAITQDEAREQPIILLGAFSNPWALQWSLGLRYYFHREMGEDGVRVSIRDRKDPRKQWSIPYLIRERTTVDFALVSRVVDPVSHSPVIAIAGLTHYGTQAAAAYVTNEAILDQALRDIPEVWKKSNLQIVLETQVINRTPTRSSVVASAAW